MSLVWNSITFTAWHHLASERPRQAVNKALVYFDAVGMDVMNLGAGNTPDSALMIVFAPGGGTHNNAFFEDNEAAITAKIASIRAAQNTATKAQLDFDGKTYTNMVLVRFEPVGPVKPFMRAGTIKKIRDFVAVFMEHAQ